jgi:uncharacterized protein YkwD
MKRLLPFLLLVFLATPVQAAESDFAEELLAAINAFRADEGLQPLSRDATLDAVSQGHSDYMVRGDFVGHVGPDGRDLPVRVEDAGYDYRVLAENIAAGPDTPEAVLQSWLDSPPHAHNLRLAEASQIGLGYAAGSIVVEEGVASDVWTVILAAPSGSASAAASDTDGEDAQAVVVSQPTYATRSTLKPRGSAQGTP